MEMTHQEKKNKGPIDESTGQPIPEWPMRLKVMEIIEAAKSGSKTVALAREELIYLIRSN